MVEAEVHGGEALVADGRHLLAHEEVAGEVEAGSAAIQGKAMKRSSAASTSRSGSPRARRVKPMPPRRAALTVSPSASPTPRAGSTLIQRASRSPWSTTPGTAVSRQSAIDSQTSSLGPPAIAASAIAASANG